MPTTASDTFAGSGALGISEVGSLLWITSGSWTRSGGKAVTATAQSAHPYAVVDLAWADVDITATLGLGDAVYFRVTDSANWCRVRNDYRTDYGTSSYWVPEHVIYTLLDNATGQIITSPSLNPWASGSFTYISSQTVPGYWQSYQTSSMSYFAVLERSRQGVVTEIGRVANAGTTITALRLIARKGALQIGANGGTLQAVTDPAPLAGTRHGIGRGVSSSSASNLDQVTLTSLSSAPNSPILTSPPSNAPVNVDLTNRLTWQFSDDDPGDSQSAFSLRWRLTGAPTWTTLTVSTPNAFRDFPAGTWTAGTVVEWQVQTTDQSGRVGPWSASSFFNPAAPPVGPTWVSPVPGCTVSNVASLTWSVPDEVAYEVRRVADAADGTPDAATVYWTTGAVVSTSRTADMMFGVNGRWEHLQLRIEAASGLWSDWVDIRIRVAYTAPPIPRVTVTPVDDDSASIRVQISNGASGSGVPVVVSNTVTRIAAVEPDRSWTGVPRDGLLIDWTPTGDVPYTYLITASADNGATSTGTSEAAPVGSTDVLVNDPFALVNDPFALVG